MFTGTGSDKRMDELVSIITQRVSAVMVFFTLLTMAAKDPVQVLEPVIKM
jgi:hypothetical protein